MKSILNTLVKTIIGCAGAGVTFGVWEAFRTYAASDAAKDAYNEGYEKGLEMGKKITKYDEEESE